MSWSRAFLVSTPLLLGACTDDHPERACEGGVSALTAKVTEIVPAKPIEHDLDVSGTIARPAGVTIYNVWVAGVSAIGTGLNFDSFTAKIPYDRLVSLATATTDGEPAMAVIEVTARTNCDFEHTSLASLSVPVNLSPGIKVSRLAFEAPLISNDAGYLPADKSSSATLRLRANAEAAGAVVSLSTSSGMFVGVGAGNTITLSGDGKTDAVASCAFLSDLSAQISASSMGIATATAVTVAGAPTLVPSKATLRPGQSESVTVFTEGKVRWCQASPAPSLSATSGGTDLMAIPGGKDVTGDGRIDIEISATDPIPALATTTISCVDVFGQFSTATYTAKP